MEQNILKNNSGRLLLNKSAVFDLIKLHIIKMSLRYYGTFNVRKFESLFYKINTFLQKITTCIRLQEEQILSLNNTVLLGPKINKFCVN